MMGERRMKIALELVFTGDGRRFLNYWDYVLGNDVIVEIIDGTMVLSDGGDVDGNDGQVVNIHEFVEQVKQSKETEISKYGG